MQQQLSELQLQRGRLIERIAHQRTTLAVQVRPLTRTLDIGDRFENWLQPYRRFALEHPLVVAAAVGAIVILRPTAVMRWTRRGLVAWRTWTALRAALPGFLARLL